MKAPRQNNNVEGVGLAGDDKREGSTLLARILDYYALGLNVRGFGLLTRIWGGGGGGVIVRVL